MPQPTIPSAEELKEDVVDATKNAASSSIRNFVAGGVGGVCAVLVGHPFDLVKVRLQTAEKGVYNGAMDVVRRTIAREGLARVRKALLTLSSVIENLQKLNARRDFMLVSLPRW